MATNREGSSFIFPRFIQRFFHRPGVFSLSPPSLSRLLQRDHLLSHHTPSPPSLDQHSLSPPMVRYHHLMHLLLLAMHHGWTYQPRFAFLALVWRSLQWSLTHDFTPWRIGWTNIKLGSLLNLSLSNRGLIALRIT